MAKPIPLFATAADLLSLCEAVEATTTLHYAYIRTYPALPIPVFSSCRDIPLFGEAKHGNMFLEDSFLVLRADGDLVPQPLSRQDGSTVYSVSMANHPDGVDFIAGGLFNNETVIQSSLGVLGSEVVPGSLYSAFRKQLKSMVVKVGKAFVAPDALQHLRRGVRLTQSVKLPPSCDLKLAEA